jgi:oligoendopeptidase F
MDNCNMIVGLCPALLLTSIFCAPLVEAQQPAASPQVPESHFDYSRYFPSPQAEVQQRTELISHTQAFLHASVWTPENASHALDEGAALKSSWMLHEEYCKLRSADDEQDKEATDCQNQSGSQSSAVSSFVEKQLEAPAFASLSEADLARPHLEPYRYLLTEATENARHLLPPSEQEVLSDLADPLLSAWSDRYDALVRQVPSEVKPIQTSSGPLNPIWDRQKLSTDADRNVREAAYHARLEAYQPHRDVIAMTLLDTVRLEAALAKARNYPSAPARKYQGRLQLTEPQVREMLQAVEQDAGVLRQYQRVRAERISTFTRIKNVHSWDLDLSSGYVPTALTFEQARTLMVNAVAPLGAEYKSRFAWLVDPASGALDMNGGTKRQPGGFSVGYPSVPISLYVDRFNGNLDSIDQLIHEAGHAIHRKLLSDAGVSPYYAGGPNFVSEAYAIFNELLLWHELAKEATTPQERAYYQERLLDEVTFQIFTSAEEGELEQGLYDGVIAGTIRNADDIDKLNGGILDRYELFAPQEPFIRLNWMRKRLLINDPLYLISYLYAGLVACKLYDIIEADPTGFAKRYTALLSAGFDAPADDLMKKNMGFSLDGKSLLDGALDLVRKQTSQLQESYASLSQ